MIYESSITVNVSEQFTNVKALAVEVFMLKPGPLDERNIAGCVEECEQLRFCHRVTGAERSAA